MLLGAYDRFNYGDLLFPHVIRRELSLHDGDLVYLVHALVASDMSRWGGLPTESLRRLMRRFGSDDRVPVVFAGGGLFGASWKGMLANLFGPRSNMMLYYASRLLGHRRVEAMAAKWLGGRSPHPWIMSPFQFPFEASVHYNAVGGSELAQMPSDRRKSAMSALSDAAYLSVRDDETARLLAPLADKVDVHLAPDSAVLVSEQYTLANLEQEVRPQIRSLVAAATPYLCFHAAPNYVEAFEDSICRQIEEICRREGLRCMLLPIARYSGLEDATGLARLRKRVKTPTILAGTDTTIEEIMYLIAKSAVFCGTSLHGNITAQSFAVPHVGLSLRPCKVDYYLRSWDISEQALCPPIDDLARILRRSFSVPEKRRQDLRRELIALSRNNFARLYNAVRVGKA